MRVVLLSSDLMVVSRVQGAAGRSESTVRAAAPATGAIELLSQEPADLVVIDLGTSLDVEALVSQIKSIGHAAPSIVAFGPHVHEDRLTAARSAGCDEVMSRGQFFSQIEQLLVTPM
jgi:DNA-binding NarL/FixJ family response regulator